MENNSTRNAVLLLNDLATTLDLKSSAEKLGISKKDATALLARAATELARIAPPVKAPAPPVTEGGHVVVNVDGASRGNPGKAGAGAILKAADGTVIRTLTKYLGVATNNIAEYEALILALEEVVDAGFDSVKVFSDSELIVKQIKGQYRVKNEDLKGLYAIAIKLVGGFTSFEIEHVRREHNAEADELANQAIDEADS